MHTLTYLQLAQTRLDLCEHSNRLQSWPSTMEHLLNIVPNCYYCVCMYMCMYMCMYIYIYICMCVCMYVCMYIYRH